MSEDQLLTIQQVSDWLQIPVSTLRQWRTRGAPGSPLPAIKIGVHLRYRRAAVEAWLDEQTLDRTRPQLVRRRSRSA